MRTVLPDNGASPIPRQNAEAAVERQSEFAEPAHPVLPCQKNCWIEVQLLDDADRPVAKEPYWIRLPDGAIREGRLNDEGYVRFDGIPCGNCTVRFPVIDSREIALSASLPKENKHWIEIQLFDMQKQPAAAEPYSITLPDGSTREGTLDAKGRARIDGIPEGNCVVRFPSIDQSSFVPANPGA